MTIAWAAWDPSDEHGPQEQVQIGTSTNDLFQTMEAVKKE